VSADISAARPHIVQAASIHTHHRKPNANAMDHCRNKKTSNTKSTIAVPTGHEILDIAMSHLGLVVSQSCSRPALTDSLTLTLTQQ